MTKSSAYLANAGAFEVDTNAVAPHDMTAVAAVFLIKKECTIDKLPVRYTISLRAETKELSTDL